MSKKQLNLSSQIMSRIHREHITMKPKWYFILGSVTLFIGIVATSILTVFFISLISFSLRTHGPMGDIRYQQLLSSFPWWAPIAAIVGIGCGIFLFKKYDFSYKKNFAFFIFVFIIAAIFTGWLIDYTNLDSYFMRQGLMKRIYQQYNGAQNGRGWRNSQIQQK